MTISSPKFLTRQLHLVVLQELRNALNTMKLQTSLPDSLKNLRVRNWLFLYDEGTPTVDIIIDKGYNPADIERNVVPRSANTLLSFEECSMVHEFILSTNALDSFSDDVSVRVGSPGSEPTLFDVDDYKASIGNMVRLEVWEPIDGRSKFTMILVDIFQKEGNSVAVVSEGSKRVQISLDNVKTAFVLPFHPASKSVKTAKKSSLKLKTK